MIILLFAEARKEKILRKINKYKRVQVKELSNEFDVSDVTIRRDLGELEESGYLLRTHGGAVSLHLIRGMNHFLRIRHINLMKLKKK